MYLELILSVIVALAADFAITYFGYYILKKKGYKAAWWLLVGMFCGWIGLFVILFVPESRKSFENDIPEHYLDEIAKEAINNSINNLHNVALPRLLVFGITGPMIISLLSTPLMFIMPQTRDTFTYMECLKVIVASLSISGAILLVDFIILFALSYSWRSVNHVNAVLHNAKQLKLYNINVNGKEYKEYDYLSDIAADYRQKMLYSTTYLGISDNFIYGIVWADKNTFNFIPVVVPKNRIVRIHCDYSTEMITIPSGGNLIGAVMGSRSYHYTGGYEVYLDNGKKIVIAYGNKFEMKKARKKLEETGIPID